MYISHVHTQTKSQNFKIYKICYNKVILYTIVYYSIVPYGNILIKKLKLKLKIKNILIFYFDLYI